MLTGDSEKLTLAEEQLTVGKRRVETARVRVSKRVVERAETVDMPLQSEYVDIRRVQVDRVVESRPAPRREGEVTIIPVVEERLMVTKVLVLKEEVHITLRQRQVHETQRVTLRREELSIEREPHDSVDPP